MDLKSSLSPTLTENVINLLNKSDILSVIAFVKEDPFKLSQVTYLEIEAINQIKNDILKQLQPYSGSHYESNLIMIKTGIDK